MRYPVTTFLLLILTLLALIGPLTGFFAGIAFLAVVTFALITLIPFLVETARPR